VIAVIVSYDWRGRGETYHGSEAHELDNNESADSVEDASGLSEAIVEDLGNWLHDWTGED
jgi:hypothetical protein